MEIVISHRNVNSYIHSERGYNAMIKSARTIVMSQTSFGVAIENIC